MLIEYYEGLLIISIHRDCTPWQNIFSLPMQCHMPLELEAKNQ